VKPQASLVGTSPFGLSARYSGVLFLPNGPPTSSRSNGMSSSLQHHSTFCTLLDVLRPRIFSIVIVPCSIRESVFRRERPARSRPNAGNTPHRLRVHCTLGVASARCSARASTDGRPATVQRRKHRAQRRSDLTAPP